MAGVSHCLHGQRDVIIGQMPEITLPPSVYRNESMYRTLAGRPAPVHGCGFGLKPTARGGYANRVMKDTMVAVYVLRGTGTFTVEGFALAHALTELPDEQVELIRSMARNAGADAPCPLLSGGVCLLYNARPIICRTHGLPLLMVVDGEHRIDFCPLNFKGVEALPGGSVLDLERLNIALAAVNAHFIETVHIDAKADDRLSVAEALLLEL